MEVALSLGSNLGSRLKNLKAARKAVSGLPRTRIIAQSFVYETEPVGVANRFQCFSFLNAVVIIETALHPAALAKHLKAIEHELGRPAHHPRNHPRMIDLDILYADALRLCTPTLTIPHPLWAKRRFVVQPLADVRPRRILPSRRRTVRQLLLSLPDNPKVILLKRKW